MSYIQGEGRSQGTLFPVVLDDLIPADHICRVLDVFVVGLSMAELGFKRAKAAETGRPGYDPRDLLKLYLYGYLHQLRSTRLADDSHRILALPKGCAPCSGESQSLDNAPEPAFVARSTPSLSLLQSSPLHTRESASSNRKTGNPADHGHDRTP